MFGCPKICVLFSNNGAFTQDGHTMGLWRSLDVVGLQVTCIEELFNDNGLCAKVFLSPCSNTPHVIVFILNAVLKLTDIHWWFLFVPLCAGIFFWLSESFDKLQVVKSWKSLKLPLEKCWTSCPDVFPINPCEYLNILRMHSSFSVKLYLTICIYEPFCLFDDSIWCFWALHNFG